MTLPMPDVFPPQPTGPVHEPEPDDREPKTRRKLLFWDRSKVFVILAVILFFSVAIKKQEIPIMTWGDAWRDQVSAKWWVLALGGVEILRQVHLFVCERSAGYNQFWDRKVWGRWEARMSRLNPWLRYRLARLVRVTAWLSIALLIFASIWGVSFLEAVVQAPARLWSNPFGDAGFPWFFQVFFLMFMAVGQFVAIFWFLSKGGVDVYMPGDIRTRFSDVWGQDKVLEKVKENIVFLEKPEEIEGKGGHVPGGVLLWGPPGTGKTLMAEAVAGETGKPYVFVDPGAFTNMFMGVGILKVKSLFRKLRKLSLKYGGVIVFFDEADTLGNRGQLAGGFGNNRASREEHRSVLGGECCNVLSYVGESSASRFYHESLERLRLEGASAAATVPRGRGIAQVIMAGMGGGGAGMGTLQALLTEMSGLKKPRGMFSRWLRTFLSMKPKQPPRYRILVMMATNMPQALDEALLRPGRIDRMYKVDYPALEGRIRTFQGYFKKVKHVVTDDQVGRLATMSPHASGAMIKDIVNESLIVAIRNGRDTVTWPDVLEAKAFKVHGLADGVAPTELEQHETAIHEAAHAVATYLLRRRDVIDIATIEQRGDVGGFVSWVPVEERKFDWRTELEHDVMVALASLAGERIFFDGDNSVGVGGDLGKSTAMVRRMLARSAMGSTLTSHVPDPSMGMGSTMDDLSVSQRNDFDAKVEAKLQELYDRSYQLMYDNRWFLCAIAHALQAHRTISGEDIDAIYKGTQGPTLDGAAYRESAFLEQYGAYLTAAQEAHRTQGKLTVPLPRFAALPVPAYAHSYGPTPAAGPPANGPVAAPVPSAWMPTPSPSHQGDLPGSPGHPGRSPASAYPVEEIAPRQLSSDEADRLS